MNITANSPQGRVLIVLRAGRISFSGLRERIPTAQAAVVALEKSKLIEKTESGWQITAAGREVCPNRRDAQLEPLHASKNSKCHSRGWISTRQQQGAAA